MKKKSWLICFTLSLVLVGAFLSYSNEKIYATNGGEVPTQGEITLIDDSTEVSRSFESSEDPKTSDSSSVVASPIKPKGRFPSTGELVKAGLSVGGLALIVAVFIFFFVKKRRLGSENDGGDK